jgi:hypothetical protein
MNWTPAFAGVTTFYEAVNPGIQKLMTLSKGTGG